MAAIWRLDEPESAAVRPTRPAGTNAHQRFVAGLYTDLLRRDPEAAELEVLAGALDQGAGRAALARRFLMSRDYRNRVVRDLYLGLLRRPADPRGLANLVNLLGTGGTVTLVQALLLGSEEYYRWHGGTDDGFVRALFRDLLGRPPAATTLDAFRDVLDAVLTRTQAAELMLASADCRNVLIDDLHWRFLNRPASAAERRQCAGLLNQGERAEDLIARLVGSEEYFARLSG
jgi:hypothetical protein